MIFGALERYPFVFLGGIRQQLLHKIHGGRFLGFAQIVQTTGRHEIIRKIAILGARAFVRARVLLYLCRRWRRL